MDDSQKIITLNQQNKPQEIDIDILELFHVVWQRKWIVITLTIIVSLITALQSMRVLPLYTATATMHISQNSEETNPIDKIYGFNTNSWDYLTTQHELLRSREIAAKVVNKLDLTNHPDYYFDTTALVDEAPQSIGIKEKIKQEINKNFPGFLPPKPKQIVKTPEQQLFDSTVASVKGSISIDPIEDTELIAVNVTMLNRELAAQIANAVVESYIQNQLDTQMEATMTATNWMNSRLSELKIKLQESEANLQAFKDDKGLLDLDGIVTLSANELSSVNERLIEARAKLAEIQSQYGQIKSIRKSDWQRLSTVPAIQSNSLVQSFKADLAKAKANIEELSKRYGSRHPSMQAARAEQTAAEANLKSQVDQVVAGIKRQFQIASANVSSLRRSVAENKNQVQSVSKNEFQLRTLQREVEVNRALFETFMTRLKETTAVADFDETNARMVDEALVPTYPINTKAQVAIATAAFLTFAISVGLILLLHLLNNTFKSSEEIENKLNLPVLGIMPKIKNKKGIPVAQAFHKDADRIFSECVRTIRTSVMLSSIDKPHKTVMVTSSIPGEGKSTVSINIADAIGQMEKTLLLEADMRRPTIAKVMNLPPGAPGLANLIAGNATYEECTQSLYGGIDAIPAGLVPPNPLELLSSVRFKEVLKELEAKYDRIIIDCPPVSAVSDAVLLSTLAESVIFVVKSESTDQKIVKRSTGTLLQNNAPIKGVVLNQVDVKKAKKKGYSYQGYYDYYGYSDSKKV